MPGLKGQFINSLREAAGCPLFGNEQVQPDTRSESNTWRDPVIYARAFFAD